MRRKSPCRGSPGPESKRALCMRPHSVRESFGLQSTALTRAPDSAGADARMSRERLPVRERCHRCPPSDALLLEGTSGQQRGLGRRGVGRGCPFASDAHRCPHLKHSDLNAPSGETKDRLMKT